MFRYKEVDSAAIIFVFERCSMFFVCGSGGCVACSLVVVVEVLLAVCCSVDLWPPTGGRRTRKSACCSQLYRSFRRSSTLTYRMQGWLVCPYGRVCFIEFFSVFYVLCGRQSYGGSVPFFSSLFIGV